MNLREAERMATALMREHGIARDGWMFQWDRAVKRFGSCNYKLKRITLSRHLTELNDVEEVRQTILHEIAHALAGSRAGHGRVWLNTARGLGYTGSRTHDAEVPVAPWKGTCPSCGKSVERHRRKQIACGACCIRYNGGKFSEEYKFRWTPNPAANVLARKS